MCGTDVYYGSCFNMTGGNPISNIARWDGVSWHALGSGVGGDLYPHVYAIAVSHPDVYVGGSFSQAGGIPVNNIARWDGSSWHALGSGVSSFVYALAVSGSDLIAGGFFTHAGDGPANHIARWDGSSWHAFGSGVAGGDPWTYVSALAAVDSSIYAGGTFTQAGGNPANYIARWDGSSWHPLGSGVGGVMSDPFVAAIATSGPDVFVGGRFTNAGGTLANQIARWDGSSWHPLGNGLVGGYAHVNAIAVSGSELVAGGWFSYAGGVLVNHIARWVPESTGIEPPSEGAQQVLHASPNPMSTGTNLFFRSTGLSPLTLSIYNTAGRLVLMQYLGTLPIGSHSHYWDGCDENGSALASGVYFVRVYSPVQQASTRVVLVR